MVLGKMGKVMNDAIHCCPECDFRYYASVVQGRKCYRCESRGLRAQVEKCERMTVFVVLLHDMEGSIVYGIFSSKEKAEEVAEAEGEKYLQGHYDIEEWELDKWLGEL